MAEGKGKDMKKRGDLTAIQNEVTLTFRRGADRKAIADELKRRIADVIDHNLAEGVQLPAGEECFVILSMFTNLAARCAR